MHDSHIYETDVAEQRRGRLIRHLANDHRQSTRDMNKLEMPDLERLHAVFTRAANYYYTRARKHTCVVPGDITGARIYSIAAEHALWVATRQPCIICDAIYAPEGGEIHA